MIDTLVTGGSGFIGSHLVRALVKEGKKVRVYDNNFRGEMENLREVRDKIDILTGDIRDFDLVRKASRGVKTIFHLAYINGTEYFYTKPDLVLDVGVKGTLNILDASVIEGVENFIFASSSEIYQTSTEIPTTEKVSAMIPDVKNPRYSYGGSKILGELLTLHYIRDKKIRRVIFRPHNIFGPGMGWEHVMPQLLKKIYGESAGFKKNEATINIQGTGEETRSFCYIDDAINGILLCAKNGIDGEIYNIGKEEEVSISNLVKEIANILGIKITTKPSALEKGSIKRRCPNVDKLKCLGYSSHVSLRDGLKETIEWYKKRLIDENGSH